MLLNRKIPVLVYLLLCVWIPFLVVIMALIGWMSRQSHQREEARLQEDVEIIARSLARPIRRALIEENFNNVSEAMNAVFSFSRVYGAYLFDPSGRLMLQVGKRRNQFRDTDIPRKVRDNAAYGDFDDVSGIRTYSFFLPIIMDDGNPLGLLQVSRRESDFKAAEADQNRQMLTVLLISISLASVFFVLGYRFAVGIRFRELKMVMERIAAGDYNTRSRPDGPREFAHLAITFNQMLDSIDRAGKQIRENQKREIDLKERLWRSQRFASMGEMAAFLTHELGGPLSAIDAHAQIGLRSASEPKVVDSLQHIRTEIGRMEQFIRQILEFGKGNKGELSRYNPMELVQPALRRAKTSVERNINIVLEDIVDTEAYGYKLRLQLALKNLIQNALQWASTEVRIRAYAGEAGVVYQVFDDGPGVPAERLPVVFEPFVSTRMESGGSGLGLSLVRQVADEHHGWVRCVPDTASGACFELFIPLNAGEKLI